MLKKQAKARILHFSILFGILLCVVLLPSGGSDPEEGPEEITTRTASTDKVCKGDTCTLTLYSGTRNVYEDGGWKRVENARSLKDKGFNVVYLENDSSFSIEVEDFNISFINLSLDFKGNPEDYPTFCQVTDSLNAKCDFKLDEKWNEIDNLTGEPIEKSQLKFQYKWEMKQGVVIKGNKVKYEYKSNPFGRKFKFGGNSATIMLQDADTENLDDGEAQHSDGDYETGGRPEMFVGTNYAGAIKFNLSSLPGGSNIEESILYLYLYENQLDTGESLDIQAFHMYASPTYNWTEGNCSDTRVACANDCTGDEWCANNYPTNGEYNQTYESNYTVNNILINVWINFSVINMVSRDYSNGEEDVSMWLNATIASGDPLFGDILEFWTKEYITDTSLRPYLNITYTILNTPPIITTPTIFPDVVHRFDTLNCSTTPTDNHTTTINVSFKWWKNNTHQPTYDWTEQSINNTLTYTHNVTEQLKDGDIWMCEAWGSDGEFNGTKKNSTTITVSDKAPFLSTPTILPVYPHGFDSLNCSTTPKDNETLNINVTFTWYKNNTPIDTYNSTNTTTNNTIVYTGKNVTEQLKGRDVWICEAQATDGAEWGTKRNSSAMTIIEEAPYLSDPILLPIKPYTTNQSECYTTPLDNETTDINVSFRWYLNGTYQDSVSSTNETTNNTQTYSYNLTGLKVDDTWICEVTGTGGLDNSSKKNSSALQISDIPLEIHSNVTSPVKLTYNDTFLIQINTTTSVDANWINHCNFTLHYPNLSIVYDGINGTNRTDLWNSSSFNINQIGNWTWNVSCQDNLGNVSTANYSVLVPVSIDIPQNDTNIASDADDFYNISLNYNIYNTSAVANCFIELRYNKSTTTGVESAYNNKSDGDFATCQNTTLLLSHTTDFTYDVIIYQSGTVYYDTSSFDVNYVGRPPAGGGGGGGAPSAPVIVIVGNLSWSMESDTGAGSYYLYIPQKGERTKRIILSNLGTEEVNVSFSCVENRTRGICKYVTYEPDMITLPPTKEERMINVTIDYEEAPYTSGDISYFSIRGEDQQKNPGNFYFTIEVSRWGIFFGLQSIFGKVGEDYEIKFSKLKAGAKDFKVPMMALILVAFAIPFGIIFLVFRKKAFSLPLAIGAGSFISFMTLILL